MNRTGDIRSQGIPCEYSPPDLGSSYASLLTEQGLSYEVASGVHFSDSAPSVSVVDNVTCSALIHIEKEEKPVFDQIIGNLYLGNLAAASKIWDFTEGIHVVVDASSTSYKELPGKEYVHIDIEDNRASDISIYFDRVSDIISGCCEGQRYVLVHCREGVSRSVTLILAHLMKRGHAEGTGMLLREAIEFLKGRRTHLVHPNIGFFRQLLKYEEKLFGKCSLSVTDYRTTFASTA